MTSTGVADDDQTVLNNGEPDVEGNGSTASLHLSGDTGGSADASEYPRERLE
jgi:hypothetical protein